VIFHKARSEKLYRSHRFIYLFER